MKPIIFSGEMIRAILEGRKTQTRRVIKPQPSETSRMFTHNDKHIIRDIAGDVAWDQEVKCLYGQPGDRLFITQGAISSSKSIPFEERFWGRVIKTDTCWEWMGHTNRKKYGMIHKGGPSYAVHRLSWQIHNGDIPAGMHVLHTCDIPWCVNPSHLWLGTNADNIADKISKGRHYSPSGERQKDSRLTWKQVNEIRALYWEQNIYQKDIAEKFGIHQSQVSKIVRGKQWKDSSPPKPPTGSRTLEVVSVRVERVQDITGEGIEAEGCDFPDAESFLLRSERFDPWIRLWDTTNAKRGYGWDVNPWVWVVEFKVITP